MILKVSQACFMNQSCTCHAEWRLLVQRKNVSTCFAGQPALLFTNQITTTMSISSRMKGWAVALMAAFPLVIVSCDKENGKTQGGFTPSDALLQVFQEDFPQAVDVQWEQYDVYAVASFSMPTKATASSRTAWYTNTATPELVQEQRNMPGLEYLPDAVRAAFNASVYNDPQSWRVDEVEIHFRHYDYSGVQTEARRIYKIELDAIAAGRPDVDLFYEENGTLLNEKLDYDDDDRDGHGHWDDDDMPISGENSQSYVDFLNQKYPDYRIEELEREYSREYGMLIVAELERKGHYAKDDDDWDDDRYEDELTVYMKEDATWLGTSKDMAYRNLPTAVFEAVGQKYPASQWEWEDDAKEWDTPERTLYSVELEQEGRYETEVTAFFAEDGTFVKEVKKFD